MGTTGHYDIPPWAAIPPSGYHLDVMKGEKLIQKLMIDQKKHYLFGRNPQQNDFCIDHASCSRVHSALVYHKDLERAFLVDLGSTHGTFIGHMRLEAHKPTQLPLDSRFHFGASTRQYILRARPPNPGSRQTMEELERSAADNEGGLFGIKEVDLELDNLTEFNTAHNRRISMLGIPDEEPFKKKRKKLSVTFNDEEEIINPEDIDPSVGRFRNLVQSTVIPSAKKRPKIDTGLIPHPPVKHHYLPKVSLYDDDLHSDHTITTPYFTTLSNKLGLPVIPNPAPEIEEEQHIIEEVPVPVPQPPKPSSFEFTDEPKKKKYAKEAWPGKKHGPGSNLLV